MQARNLLRNLCARLYVLCFHLLVAENFKHAPWPMGISHLITAQHLRLQTLREKAKDKTILYMQYVLVFEEKMLILTVINIDNCCYRGYCSPSIIFHRSNLLSLSAYLPSKLALSGYLFVDPGKTNELPHSRGHMLPVSRKRWFFNEFFASSETNRQEETWKGKHTCKSIPPGAHPNPLPGSAQADHALPIGFWVDSPIQTVSKTRTSKVGCFLEVFCGL